MLAGVGIEAGAGMPVGDGIEAGDGMILFGVHLVHLEGQFMSSIMIEAVEE